MRKSLSVEARNELLELAGRLRSGKRVAHDRYLHFDNVEAGEVLATVARAILVPDGANVLRIGKGQAGPTVSFSYYDNFFDEPFPKLVWSEHHNLATGAVTRRSEGKNPAILHRKELLLSGGDPRRDRYEELTRALIAKRLLPTREFIGRDDQWRRYLTRRGFEIRGSALVPLGGA